LYITNLVVEPTKDGLASAKTMAGRRDPRDGHTGENGLRLEKGIFWRRGEHPPNRYPKLNEYCYGCDLA
jgi:hypothetical protein